ncbi:MAG: cysteine--tRNA ligase [Candidatus Omnitrophica bacterium]|nr:cysteine--tRNA ligase [Candidatus Omnitrophota bacterium]
MKIYNSLTRKKEDLVPISEKKIGMYVCGPTVYDEPHIGHARSAYIFDVIRRYMKHKGYEVTFVRNITDVDDKIINKAKDLFREKPDLIESTKEVSKKYLDAYNRDMKLLGIGRPDREPKATEYIPKMIEFIEELIRRGAAYAVDGDVYFNIKAARDYGKLSKQNMEKMEIGARISSHEKKKDGLDFALWKSAKEGEPFWDSPWGKGRPGWHIECSVMSSDILGDEFDIHGGGIDLIFPHHENEVAQSEGAGKKFARHWMHNGLLTIAGEKMAKSLGNFISIQDFIKRYRDADYLKLLFLNTHYRHPVDYTEEKIGEMKAQKERFTILFDKIDRIVKKTGASPKAAVVPSKIEDEMKRAFEEAMDDDFNTPLALAALFDAVTAVNKLMIGKDGFNPGGTDELASAKRAIARLADIFALEIEKDCSKEAVDEAAVLKLIEKRNEARKRKDFTAADDIRRKLSEEFGVVLDDTKDGTVWRKKA